VASKLSHLLRHPAVLLVMLAVVALFAARFGGPHFGGPNPVGLWDGPI